MSKDIIFDSSDEFISAMKEMNIQKAAFSEVNERRAEHTENDMLEVIVVRKADIIAYKDSVIYKYSEKSDNLDELYNKLIDEGFEIKRINKNII